MPGPPYRALVMGSLQPGYYTATNDASRTESILPAMKALLDYWESPGDTGLIGSFDDDLFIVGLPASIDFSIPPSVRGRKPASARRHASARA